MGDVASASLGAVLLILRVAVVGLLYLFVWQSVRAVLRELRTEGAAARPRADSAPYGKLVVVQSGPTGLPVGTTFALEPVTTIGRGLDNHIHLNDTFLSNNHARLLLDDDKWLLEDLQSRNGTFLNGFAVRGSTPLAPGDMLRFGQVELRLDGRA